MQMGWVRYSNSKTEQADEGTYWISISDLMAGLLIIFILTLTYYMLNFSQATAQLTENNIKRAAILQSLKEELQKKGIEVKIDLEHGVLRLPEGILFDVGKAKINDNGLRVIRALGPVLNEVLRRPEYKGSVETVFIEGHTDNVPIHNYRFASNWELSTQRAINTWKAVLEAEPDLKGLKNKNGEPLFSCSGYADTRPVRSNETPEGRRENRRIDFRFSMTPPSKDEPDLIKDVRGELAQ